MAEGEVHPEKKQQEEEEEEEEENHSSSSSSSTTTAAANNNRGKDCNKSTGHMVLIHGICGGAWCWYKMKPLLEMSGYKVSCLDLKSAGIDPADADSVLTFEEYNQPLDSFMDSLPEGEKVVLVGHSAGGLSVTWATHKYPHKVQGGVYVAATMLERGYQTIDDLKIGTPDVSELGDTFDYEYGLGTEAPPTSAVFKEEYLRKLVFPLSPLEDFTLAAMLSRPGPLLALLTAKFDDDDGHHHQLMSPPPPRVYIKTKRDELMKREQQEAMIHNWQPSAIYDIESDHTPFFSSPLLLFRLILNAHHHIFAASTTSPNHEEAALA